MEILTNKSYKSYDYLSRYTSFPYYYHTLDNKYIYGVTSQLNDNTSYQAYTIKQGDTYDSIALYFYNNPTYWWVLLDFNRIPDAFSTPVPGDILKIPTLAAVSFQS